MTRDEALKRAIACAENAKGGKYSTYDGRMASAQESLAWSAIADLIPEEDE